MEFESIRDAIHFVFDDMKEYADHWLAQGIPAPSIIRDWRKANELDWVWSDDKRIVQILRKGNMKSTVRSSNKKFHAKMWMRTIVGTFTVAQATIMDTDFSARPKGCRYRFSKKIYNNKYVITHREENTNKENMVVYFIAIVRDDPVSAYMKVYGTNNYKYAKEKVYLLLNQERIKVAIRKEMKKTAKDLGMNDEYYLTRIKAIIDDQDNKKTMPRIAAIKLGADLTGAFEKEEDIPSEPTGQLTDGGDNLKKRLQASKEVFEEVQDEG